MNTSAAQLTDDRIAAMRGVVTDAVSSDMARRGRRARRTLAGIVVAGVVVTAIGVGASHGGGPTAGGQAASDSAGGAADFQSNAAAPGAAMQPTGTMDTFTVAGTATSLVGSAAGGGVKAEVPAEDGSQVVVTGTVKATVDSPTAAADRLVSWVEAHGGRVGNSTQSGTGDHTTATLTVHVPDLNAAIDQVRTMGEVTSMRTNQDDVTLQVTDLKARIAALETSVKRLTEFLANAKTTTELIRAEQVLTNRQGQLDSLRSQRAYLADQVALQTLTISLVPPKVAAAAKAPDATGFRGGLVHGWNALVDMVSAIVTGVGAALPWLGLLVVLAGVAWVAVRVSRRRVTR